MDAGPWIGVAVPVVDVTTPALAQISAAESGIRVSYCMPVAGVPFSNRGRTADKRNPLRLICSRSEEFCSVSHEHRFSHA